MRHDLLNRPEEFDVVEPAEIVDVARQPEHAVPDLPAAIGLMIAAVYLTIIALLALTIANAGQAPFMIVIDLAFLAAFLSVPAIFLKLEADPARRPSLGRFMSQGMQTYTGPVSGGGALAQIFVVPVLLAFGVLAIGIIAMVA